MGDGVSTGDGDSMGAGHSTGDGDSTADGDSMGDSMLKPSHCEVHVSLLFVCSLASDSSPVSFTGGVQRERSGNMLTFSSQIYSDLIITAARTLHTETLSVSTLQPDFIQAEKKTRGRGREEEWQNVTRCVSSQHESLCSLFNYKPTKGQIISNDKDVTMDT